MHIGILLSTSPVQFENWETAINVADAALDKGHEVTLVLLVDGVYAAVRPHSLPASIGNLHKEFTDLLRRGTRVLVCGTAAQARGLEFTDYLEGVVVGGLPDFALLLAKVDRLLSL